MNLKPIFLAALVAGLLPVSAIAQASPEVPASPSQQTPSAPTPATSGPSEAAPKPPAPPSAFAAKIAIVEFEQAVILTNEGKRALDEIKTKFQPKQTALEALNTEIVALQKQLQGAPSTMTDEERATRTKTLDTKQKQLDRDTEDARNSYQAELQDAYGKVAQKVHAVMLKYVEKNGYTILLDVSNEQQSPVMWIAQEPNSDITEAVVKAYNAESGIAAPGAAPAAATHPKPATTTPHTTTTTPHSTPAKPPSQ
jgi:Skp family chaperone for outer membrane proteins